MTMDEQDATIDAELSPLMMQQCVLGDQVAPWLLLCLCGFSSVG